MALAVWGLTNSAYRGLLFGDADPVVASVTDVERLVSARFGWFADTGVEVIPLGLPFITPDQRLLAWRFRPVLLRDGAEVGLLLLGEPQSGDPVLLVDDAGSRQWRTLR